MLKNFLVLTFLVVAAGVVYAAEKFYTDTDLSRWLYTFIALAVIYFVFKIMLEGVLARRIQDNKNRYKFRKTISLIYLVVFSVVLVRIWVEDPQSLLVAYGLVGAGVAIALQDVFKNFVGGFLLLANNSYRVGDRIEVNGTFGDVIDIRLLNTTLLELRGWVEGDQATGRLTSIPNGATLSEPVYNYTRDHHYIWEEISIPITYDSNWQKALKLIDSIVTEHTKDATAKAEESITHIGEKYYLSKRDTEPNVFVSMTDNWIDFHIRFVTDVRTRRVTHNEISQKILSAILSEKDISVASETLVIQNK